MQSATPTLPTLLNEEKKASLSTSLVSSSLVSRQAEGAIAFCEKVVTLIEVGDVTKVIELIKNNNAMLMSYDNLLPNHDLSQSLYNVAVALGKLDKKCEAVEENKLFYRLAMQAALSETSEQQMHFARVFRSHVGFLLYVEALDSVTMVIEKYGSVLRSAKHLERNDDLCIDFRDIGYTLSNVNNLPKQAGFFYQIAMQMAESKTKEQQMSFAWTFNENMLIFREIKLEAIEIKKFIKEYGPVLEDAKLLEPCDGLSYLLTTVGDYLAMRSKKDDLHQEAAFVYKLAMRVTDDKVSEDQQEQLSLRLSLISLYYDLSLDEQAKSLLSSYALEVIKILQAKELFVSEEMDMSKELLIAVAVLEKQRLSSLALPLIELAALLPECCFNFARGFHEMIFSEMWQAATHLLTVFARNKKKLPIDLNHFPIYECWPYMSFLVVAKQETLLQLSSVLGANASEISSANTEEMPICSSLYYAGIQGDIDTYRMLLHNNTPLYRDSGTMSFIHRLVQVALEDKDHFETYLRDYRDIFNATIKHFPAEQEREMNGVKALDYVIAKCPDLLGTSGRVYQPNHEEKAEEKKASFSTSLVSSSLVNRHTEDAIAFCEKVVALIKMGNVAKAIKLIRDNHTMLMGCENLSPNHNLSQSLINVAVELDKIPEERFALDEKKLFYKLAMQTAEHETLEQQTHFAWAYARNTGFLVQAEDLASVTMAIKKYGPVLQGVKHLQPNHDLCKDFYNTGHDLVECEAGDELILAEQAGFFYQFAMRIAESKTAEHQGLLIDVFNSNLHIFNIIQAEATIVKEFFEKNGSLLKDAKFLVPDHSFFKDFQVWGNELVRTNALKEAALLYQLAIRVAEDKAAEHKSTRVSIRLDLWTQVSIRLDFIKLYFDLPLDEPMNDLFTRSALKIIELLKTDSFLKQESGANLLSAVAALEKCKFSELALSLIETAILLPAHCFRFETEFCYLVRCEKWDMVEYLLTVFIRNNKKLPIDLNNCFVSIGVFPCPYVIFIARAGQEKLLALSHQLGANLSAFTSGQYLTSPFSTVEETTEVLGCSSLYFAGIHGHESIFKMLLSKNVPLYRDSQSLVPGTKPFIHALVDRALKNRSLFEKYFKILQEMIKHFPDERAREVKGVTALDYVRNRYPRLQAALQHDLERQIEELILKNKTLNNILSRAVYLPRTFSETKMDAVPESTQNINDYLLKELLSFQNFINPKFNPSKVAREFYEKFVSWRMNWEAEVRVFAPAVLPKAALSGLDDDEDVTMGLVSTSCIAIKNIDAAMEEINRVCRFMSDVCDPKNQADKSTEYDVIVDQASEEKKPEAKMMQWSASPLSPTRPSILGKQAEPATFIATSLNEEKKASFPTSSVSPSVANDLTNEVIAFCEKAREVGRSSDYFLKVNELVESNNAALINYRNNLLPNHNLCRQLYDTGIELTNIHFSQNILFPEGGVQIFFELAMQTAESKTEEHQQLLARVFLANMQFINGSTNRMLTKKIIKKYSPVLMEAKHLLLNHDLCFEFVKKAISFSLFNGRSLDQGFTEEAALLFEIALHIADNKELEHRQMQVEILTRLIALYFHLPVNERTSDLLTRSAAKLTEFLKESDIVEIPNAKARAAWDAFENDILFAVVALDKAGLLTSALSLLDAARCLPRNNVQFNNPFRSLMCLKGAWQLVTQLLTIFVRHKRPFPFNLNHIFMGELPYVIFLAQAGQEELLRLSQQLGANLSVFIAEGAGSTPGCSSLYYAGVHGHAKAFSLLLNNNVPLYSDDQLSVRATPFIHQLVGEALGDRARFEDYFSILQQTVERYPAERDREEKREMASDYVAKRYPHLQHALISDLERELRRFILNNETLNNILSGETYLPGSFSEKSTNDELRPIESINSYLLKELILLDTFINPALTPGKISQGCYEKFVACKMRWEAATKLATSASHCRPIANADIAMQEINSACAFVSRICDSAKMCKIANYIKRVEIIHYPKREQLAEEKSAAVLHINSIYNNSGPSGKRKAEDQLESSSVKRSRGVG